VKLREQEEWRDELHSPLQIRIRSLFAAFANFIGKTITIAELEARKLHHDPYELFTRAIQPALWLLIYGNVMSRLRAIPTGDLPYIDYMTPGILAQSVLFIAIFYGIAVISERDLGIVHKMLVSPTPRTSLVLGRALSASERALAQTCIVYLLALGLGVKLNLNPLAIAGVLAVVILGSALFSIYSLTIACMVKTRERFMGMNQAITQPLFFASNAIYPISLMPDWLRWISELNPLTYEVDALRSLMVVGGSSMYGPLHDIVVLVAVIAILVVIASHLYPKIVT
jgi:ABC-2 type transport system permease protein